MNALSQWIGERLGKWLTQRVHVHAIPAAAALSGMAADLRPGDVLLVEGDTRVSGAIKYLTQSTWSHAALYVGDATCERNKEGEALCVVEADVVDGVRLVSLSTFDGMQARVCRPVGLSAEECGRVVGYARDRIGYRYDLKNVIDLARYLIPTPPVPRRWRRRMLALGSGDPTRAICSTLIAQAFQSVRYPILPEISTRPDDRPDCPGCVAEILHVRHHSLFAPRDFDLSPYFEVIKPGLAADFDFHALEWGDDGEDGLASLDPNSAQTGSRPV